MASILLVGTIRDLGLAACQWLPLVLLVLSDGMTPKHALRFPWESLGS